MKPLTENEIRASFVNTSRREAKQAACPPTSRARRPLGGARRPRLDRPQQPPRAYAVVPVDDEPVGFLLRLRPRTRGAPCAPGARTRSRPTRCHCSSPGAAPPVATATASARVHADFSCSTHVRRMPNGMEGGLDPVALVERRVAVCALVGLRPPRPRRIVGHEHGAAGLWTRPCAVATVGDASQA